MLTFKDFITESEDFEKERKENNSSIVKGVANSYLIDPKDSIPKRARKHKQQYSRILDPEKWREYLQLATAK